MSDTEKKSGMQLMLENVLKSAIGQENFDKMVTAADLLVKGVTEMRNDQKKILCEIENLNDRMGRLEKALSIPLRENRNEGVKLNG